MAPSYEGLLAQATGALTVYNDTVPTDKRVDVDKFVADVKALGGTTAELLSLIAWEQLEDLGLPVLLAKQVATIFRGAATPASQTGPATAAPARRMTASMAERAPDRDLLANFDPNRAGDVVATELRKRSGDRRFLVYTENGVDVEASLTLLTELTVQHEPERDTFVVGGTVRRVYSVGQQPPQPVPEHPLLPGTSLRRSDGTDDKGIPWGRLDLELRQLVRIAVQTGELVPASIDHHDLYERVERIGWDGLATRYPKAAVRFSELRDSGQLPPLMMLKSAGQTSAAGLPFGGNRVQ